MVQARRSKYTLEYKLEAVRLVRAGQSLAAVAQTLGMTPQSLYNWVRAERDGKLREVVGREVNPQQMEIARLRAELAKVKMERDILKKATAYFAKESL